jgi:hypothetical protein
VNRLLYESCVSHKEYLIIPFLLGKAGNYEIFSYRLLSQIPSKSRFHRAENPAQVYGNSLENIIQIAQEHLDKQPESPSQSQCLTTHYIYRQNLILVFKENGKCSYQHYPPEFFHNIAESKLFPSEYECLNWVQKVLDGRQGKMKLTSENR